MLGLLPRFSKMALDSSSYVATTLMRPTLPSTNVLRCYAKYKFSRNRAQRKPSIDPEVIEGKEGTVGASSFTTPSLDDLDRRMPTPETMKRLYDGVPFDELHVVHIKATKNNTIISVTGKDNRLVLYTSARKEGFKNARKKSQIAGQTTGTACGIKLLRRGIRTVRVLVKGLGYGRISSVQGIATTGVNVASISDWTTLPELGPRPKKIRRV